MKTVQSAIIILISVLCITTSCNNESESSFAYGNFESVEIFIPAENSGILLEFLVDEGDAVKHGQKIGLTDTIQIHLKKQQVMAAIKAVYARLEQINSQIEVQEVNLANLEREYKRFGTLFLEEAATKKQMDDLEGQIRITKAQIEALRSQKPSVYAEIEAQEAQIQQLADQLQRSVLISPGDGQILETFINQGEMVMAGRPVAKIADLSELILRIFIDGDQLSSIAIGEKVNVLYDGPEGIITTEGTISWVSPEAEFTPKIIQTREERVNLVYAVKVRVPNDGNLKIGMPGEVRLLNNEK